MLQIKTVDLMDRFEQQIQVVNPDSILAVGMDLLHT